MHEASVILQPLAAATGSIERLRPDTPPAELATALVAVADAAAAVVRNLARTAAELPDAVRLAAPGTAAAPTAETILQLRRSEVITLELAGMLHELDAAARRAAAGGARAADAETATRALTRLRAEVHAYAERGVAGDVPVSSDAAVESEDHGVSPPARTPSELAERRRTRRLMFIAGTVFLLGGLAMLVSLLRGGDAVEREAIAAFRAERFGVAEAAFREVLEREPGRVTALLYLGRIYRRQGRYDDAADVLQAAATRAPTDADVRRELGHLFMDLRRPQSAAAQFRLAVDHEPDDIAGWIGLVRALRAAEDPSAEDWLRRAPAEVRAALGGARNLPQGSP